MRTLTILPLFAMIAACSNAGNADLVARKAADEEARLAKALTGFTPGEPRNCVDSRDLRGPESFGDRTLIFRASRNLIYRTETSGSCKGVGRGDALVTRQFGSQLCKGDIARSADLVAGFQTGACAMGEFVPYRRDRKD
jgi:hypothetical protein